MASLSKSRRMAYAYHPGDCMHGYLGVSFGACSVVLLLHTLPGVSQTGIPGFYHGRRGAPTLCACPCAQMHRSCHAPHAAPALS